MKCQSFNIFCPKCAARFPIVVDFPAPDFPLELFYLGVKRCAATVHGCVGVELDIRFGNTIDAARLRQISHRDFEAESLGGDTRAAARESDLAIQQDKIKHSFEFQEKHGE